MGLKRRQAAIRGSLILLAAGGLLPPAAMASLAAQEPPPIASAAADLGPALARARERRSAALRGAAAANPQAVLDLVELGLWDEMAGLDPYAPPLAAWEHDETEFRPGIALRQLWAEVAANYTVRQRNLPPERSAQLMLAARRALDRDGTVHPVLLHELAWLYEDVSPADAERARVLKLAVRQSLEADLPSSDGGVRSHLLRIQSDLVEDLGTCLGLLDLAAAEEIDDPLARLLALSRWQQVRSRSRSAPQLDTPVAQRKSFSTSWQAGKDRRDEIERHELGMSIAQRCVDPQLIAGSTWAAAVWGDDRRDEVPTAWISAAASQAAAAWRALGRTEEAAQADALVLCLEPLAAPAAPAVWQERLRSADAILSVVQDPLARNRAGCVRGLSLQRLSAEEAYQAIRQATDELAALPRLRPSDYAEQARRGRQWLAHARLVALAGHETGAIRDQAVSAYAETADMLEAAYAFSDSAVARRELARLCWEDGPEMRQAAVRIYGEAAAVAMRQGTVAAAEGETIWRELAERQRAAGREWEAVDALVQARALWSGMRGERAQARIAALSQEIGWGAPADPGAPDTTRDATQGPGAALLDRVIAALPQAPDAERGAMLGLVSRLLGWPATRHALDSDEQEAMAARWHLSSTSSRLLASALLREELAFLAAAIPVIAHRPLAPALAEALRGSTQRRGIGIAAARLSMAVTEEDPRLGAELAEHAWSLTWDDGRRAVLAQLSLSLPPDLFRDTARRLLAGHAGQNDGSLRHLVNMLARDPSALPAGDLRRLLPLAVWKEDRDEILWALGLLGDPILADEIPRLLGDRKTPLETRSLALVLAAQAQVRAASPAVAAILAEDGPDTDERALHDDAIVTAAALGMPLDRAILQRWATEDWGADPDPSELSFSGPPQRYRILAASLMLHLTEGDAAALERIHTAVAHPWRRYRCSLVRQAGLSRHPRAGAFILDIASRDGLLLPDARWRQDQQRVYLTALSHVALDAAQRSEAERRFGQPVPSTFPVSSPNFADYMKPCDGRPAAPLWPGGGGSPAE